MMPSTVPRAIAIGGSTGALPVVRDVLTKLPPQLGAPLFLTLHTGSEGRNMLATMLADDCALKVKTAEDQETASPDVVYVAPADCHLLVIDGIVRLGSGPRENLSRPAIDPMLRSVAAHYGSGSIGVVLSGKLNDGAAGLADLKRCGGMTLVQSPLNAAASEMPLGALEASSVDFRADGEALADVLVDLLGRDPGPNPVVSDSIMLEIDIALGRPCLTQDIATFADPVALSCPSCGGVLSQVRARPLRFRCQVGHAFTAEVLEREKEGSLDEAMRVALRIVEERAELVGRLGRESEAAGRMNSARDFSRKAEELRLHADVLRRSALQEIAKGRLVGSIY